MLWTFCTCYPHPQWIYASTATVRDTSVSTDQLCLSSHVRAWNIFQTLSLLCSCCLPFCSVFGNELEKCSSLSIWPAPGIMCGSKWPWDSSPPAFFLEKYKSFSLYCFPCSLTDEMKPYTSDITFYGKSVKEILKRGYKVQWKIHVFSLLCCVPHWRWSMTLCFKGFTLYRLTVYVRVCVFVFQAHTPQSSLLFLSFTLPSQRCL